MKKMFVILLNFGGSLTSDHTKCISLNNRPCQTKPAMINISFNEPLYYPFIASANK